MANKKKCACCGYWTIQNEFDICPVCFWQSDDYQECNVFDEGGPNFVSLNLAKENYLTLGASEEEFIKYVRLPLPDER